MLTNGVEDGILTKLSPRGDGQSKKENQKTSKKVLDKLIRICYNSECSAPMERLVAGSVPCKLNNERESTRRDARKCELKV